MAAQQPARASPELRKAPLSPRYLRNYTTSGDTTEGQCLRVARLMSLTMFLARAFACSSCLSHVPPHLSTLSIVLGLDDGRGPMADKLCLSCCHTVAGGVKALI
jgi:hypothetical protein